MGMKEGARLDRLAYRRHRMGSRMLRPGIAPGAAFDRPSRKPIGDFRIASLFKCEGMDSERMAGPIVSASPS